MKASTQIFLDQLEACEPETDFWKSISSDDSPVSMDGAPHRGEGGVTTAIYQGSKLIGLSVCMRDELNRTLLICVDLRVEAPSTPQGDGATPRTDAAIARVTNQNRLSPHVAASFAKQLERELATERDAQEQMEMMANQLHRELAEANSASKRAITALTDEFERQMAEARKDTELVNGIIKHGLVWSEGTNDQNEAVKIVYSHRDSINGLLESIERLKTVAIDRAREQEPVDQPSENA